MQPTSKIHVVQLFILLTVIDNGFYKKQKCRIIYRIYHGFLINFVSKLY